ncbi:flavin monoamine oxidase family protein [Chelatococcus sp. GCM10030263]|uniref:flavin monoamine oxidase family protein n=1 Tax=Chelatococcus sp. GCM10030263 TaxID=3273387 RepID=UPI00360894E6
MASETEVAIVGGGAAGIAAARRLAEAGVDCLILEARDRLGGRAWTVEAAGFPVDLGCGWLHSADRNPWRTVAAGQSATVDKTPPPWTHPAPNPGFPIAEQLAFSKSLNVFFDRLGGYPEAEPDVPAATLLDRTGRWSALIDAVSTYFSGAELDRISVRDFARYEDSGVNWRVVEGYGTVITGYAAGLLVEFGCPVDLIDHSGARLAIGTAMGTVTAEAAIITLPSGLIAEERIRFTPALPAKVEAAAGLPLGLADKLFLALDAAEDFEMDSRLFGHNDRTATGVYHLRPFGRPQVEVYFGGSLAEELEAGGEAAFVDFAVGELVGLFGADFAKRVRPLAVHGWRGDPFARGSYSYALPGKADGRALLAAPVDDRLFFAGEACSRNDFSTAHGAYRTGIAAAEQVIAARHMQRGP